MKGFGHSSFSREEHLPPVIGKLLRGFAYVGFDKLIVGIAAVERGENHLVAVSPLLGFSEEQSAQLSFA